MDWNATDQARHPRISSSPHRLRDKATSSSDHKSPGIKLLAVNHGAAATLRHRGTIKPEPTLMIPSFSIHHSIASDAQIQNFTRITPTPPKTRRFKRRH